MANRKDEARPVKNGDADMAEDILHDGDQVPDDAPVFDESGRLVRGRIQPPKKDSE
jgi:hypothetical protein